MELFCMPTVLMVAEMEIRHGARQHEFSLTTADMKTATAKCQICQQQTNTESLMWHYSPESPARDLVGGWLHRTVFSVERAMFCPYYNRHLFWWYICRSQSQCSCPNSHPWTYRKPYPPSWHFTQHCFWPGNSPHNYRNATVNQQSWNTLVLPCHPSFWINWFHRMAEWPKDTVRVPIWWY